MRNLIKDFNYGILVAENIKRETSREDMKVMRCILCGDERNISSVLKFLGIIPKRYNKAIRTGLFVALNK